MHDHNHLAQEADHVLKEQLDSFKSEVSKLIERLGGDAVQPRLKSFVGKATEAIKAHPIAAIAAALGAGYLAVRIVRR